MPIRKLLSLALGLSLCMGALSACAGPTSTAQPQEAGLEELTVVLDWTPNTNHTGLYVALENGYYQDAGLDVTIVQPPEDGSIALVASGKAQFGVSIQENLGTALSADPPLPVTAVAGIIQHNTSGIISLKSAGIDSFKSLEGKKYATWDDPFEQSMIRDSMKAQGGDFGKVELIPSTVSDAISAIQTNVDAVWVYEAWDVVAAQLAGVDYNFIKFSDSDPTFDYYTPILIAQDEFLENNRETAMRFLEATSKGYEFAIQSPKEAAGLLLKSVPELSPDLVYASQEFLAGQYKAEYPRWGEIDESRWKAFYDWMYQVGVIQKELGVGGFTNEYLPAAQS